MTAGLGETAGSRAQPFYCPYCGESDLRPGEERSSYECATCARGFTLTFRGLVTQQVESR